MSASIEGSAWQADPGGAIGSFRTSAGSSTLAILGSRCICRSPLVPPAPGAADTVEGLQLVITRFTGPGTYMMSSGMTGDAGTIDGVVTRIVLVIEDPSPPRPEAFHSLSGGRIVVTGFDPFANRASGTFAFEAADSAGAIRHVRDGVFDVSLYNQPPPLRARNRLLPSLGP
jgi:hypothetical protein